MCYRITKELYRPKEIVSSSYGSIYAQQNFTMTIQQATEYLQDQMKGKNGFVLQQTQLLVNQELLKTLKVS